MSAHLPECDWAKDDETCHVYEGWDERTYDEHRDPAGRGICTRCQAVCICSRLRACEQRVMESDEPWQKASAAANGESYDEGYAAGLDAAREAVAGINPVGHSRDWLHCTAIAAIDALREEQA